MTRFGDTIPREMNRVSDIIKIYLPRLLKNYLSMLMRRANVWLTGQAYRLFKLQKINNFILPKESINPALLFARPRLNFGGLASNTTNKKSERAQVDSLPILPDPQETDDAFFKWLRDEKSVQIEWNTFVIEKVQSKNCTRFYLHIS